MLHMLIIVTACISDAIYIYKKVLSVKCCLMEDKKFKYPLCYTRTSRKLRFQSS